MSESVLLTREVVENDVDEPTTTITEAI